MSLNTFFDKIFCINLDRRPDRWEACLREFETYKIKDVERFPAFDNPIDGNSGCTRSHRELLRKVADGPWKKILVLEDDFHVLTYPDLVAKNFAPDSQVMQTFFSAPTGSLSARFDTMAPHVPEDWDVLYLGGGYAEPPIRRVHKHVIQCAGVLTTGSYGITKEFAGMWSAEIDTMSAKEAKVRGIHPFEVGLGAIDSLFCSLAKKYKFYIFQPRIMIQRPGKSDLNGEVGDYLFSMTDPVHENMV